MPNTARMLDDERSLFRVVIVVRQMATLMTIVGFGVMSQVVDRRWLDEFLVALVVFAVAGFAIWAANRWGRLSDYAAMVCLVFVDVLIVSYSIAQTPHPSELSMAYVALVTAASILLSPRMATAVTVTAGACGIGAVAIWSDSSELADMIAAMIMLGAIAVVIVGMRREERRIRSLLRLNQRQLDRAEAVAGLGSWQWCPSTGVVHWSDEMFRLTGRDPTGPPITFESWAARLPDGIREDLVALARNALETGDDYSYDIVYEATATTPRRVVQARGARVMGDDGEHWIVGTSQDVTELRRVDELKDEFVATASHELRTPATIVLGFVRTLDDRWDDLDDETRRTLVRQLRAGGERMSQLIEDILSLTRIEHGDLSISPEAVAIGALVRDVVEELGDPRVSAVVDSDVDQELVLGDPKRLRQVLFNLADNALRYDPSGEEVLVTVGRATGKGADSHVQVRVCDHGPGVAESDRERIFGRFVRGESSIGADSGTGLGLYVARSLVEQQGGQLWLEDRADGNDGSAFSFTIPRA